MILNILLILLYLFWRISKGKVLKWKCPLVDRKKRIKYFENDEEKILIIHCIIGCGGFGKVLKVSDLSNERYFALKKIELPNQNTSRSSMKEINEIKILELLDNINIVKYFNSFEVEDFLYIKMDLCDLDMDLFIDLKDELFSKNSSMDILENAICCDIFEEILHGVDYLHQQNPPFMHRDLKPRNILIKKFNNKGCFVRICDFGLSKIKLQSENTSNVGTINFSAPEVREGDKYNELADIYSLGKICEFLFGIRDYVSMKK